MTWLVGFACLAVFSFIVVRAKYIIQNFGFVIATVIKVAIIIYFGFYMLPIWIGEQVLK